MGYDAVVTMDADFSHDPAALPDLISAGREAPGPGLRRMEYVTTAAEAPPKEVELTHFGKNVGGIIYLETRKVESSWVDYIHLVRIVDTGLDHLTVTFLDGYTCIYTSTNVTDYFAMKSAPSKGKYVWAHLYGQGRRVISVATKTHIAGLPGGRG